MPVLQKVNLCESKLVDLTTEGVLSMIGKQNGFAELMMKAVPHAFMAHHYVIPQEDLCWVKFIGANAEQFQAN